MLKINIVEDWAPINRVPATAKDIIIVIAAASGAVCLISLVLLTVINLLF